MQSSSLQFQVVCNIFHQVQKTICCSAITHVQVHGPFFQPGPDWDWGPKKISNRDWLETGPGVQKFSGQDWDWVQNFFFPQRLVRDWTWSPKIFWSRLGLGSKIFFPHRDWIETKTGV